MNVIDITPVALEKMKKLINEHNAIGLKINIVNGGCMGLSYAMEYVFETHEDDTKLTFDDVTVFLSKKAVVFLAGIKINYVETPMNSGFTFENPNAKGNCGCGKSFCTTSDGKKGDCGSCH